MNHDIRFEYFDWLCGIVGYNVTYQKLLYLLFSINFIPNIARDENRAGDGINLRYRFACERNYSYSEVSDAIDNRDCSLLEMMIALALRCEENIMYDQDYGDRTGQWFWDMVDNLGLSSFDDYHWDEYYAKEICNDFNNANYSPDGKGGLFYIPGCDKDLRSIEIWYQMCWYLNAKYLI